MRKAATDMGGSNLPKPTRVMAVLSATLLVLLTCATATEWVTCRQQCDQNFTKDDLIEHPGIAQVCHRGCELFTVAFITTPRGGIPLIGSGLGLLKNMDPLPPNPANLFGDALITITKNEPKNNGKISSSNPSLSNWEKAKRQKQEIELNIGKQMDIIGTSKAIKGDERMRNIMEKMMNEKKDIMRRYLNIKPIEKKKDKSVNASNEEVRKINSNAEQNKNEKKEPVKAKPNPVKIISSEIVFSKSTAHNNKKNNHPNTKRPKLSITTETGAKARAILNMARNSENNVKKTKPRGTGTVPISIKVERTMFLNISHRPSNLNGSVSKTTVQPIPHPVQDHPVHATRQITTDSSGADERKTTTPQTSNPVAPESHKIQEFGVFSRLATQLGSIENQIPPIFRLNFLPKPRKTGYPMAMPQQISIIEIVKKKNTIDFEKLHQEHINKASGCPRIHQRFEEAKHSCRHACATAYPLPQEQDACVAGCQIQATTSSTQVKTQKPNVRSSIWQRTSTATGQPNAFALPPIVFGNEEDDSDAIGRPRGIFSSLSMMFSSLAGKIAIDDEAAISNIMPDFHDLTADIQKESKALAEPSAPHVGVKIVIRQENHGKYDFPRQRTGSFFLDSVFRNLDRHLHRSKFPMNPVKEDKKNGPTKLFDPAQNLVLNADSILDTMENEINVVHGKRMDSPEFILKTLENFLGKDISNVEKFADHPTKKTHTDDAEKKTKTNNNKMDAPVITDGHLFPLPEVLKANKKDCQPTLAENAQLQPLDLLDCISRKSGLPRWLIAITVFASALVVFWLCFSLSTPIDDSKSAKSKPTTVVLCETLTADDIVEADYCEKKKLLPDEDVIEINLQTV